MSTLARLTTLFFAACLLSACESTSMSLALPKEPVSDRINFVDIGRFDRELQLALLQQSEPVTVAMFDKVSPNNTPDRLQKWLNAVERNGGKVEIEPPPNELVPRNPLALISLVGGLWNVIKATTEMQDKQVTQAVKGRDAVISLERNPQGQIVVGKIIFKKSKPTP